ncbi:MAG: hypothetical protein HKN68_10860 [Saprospiraceae bacterium]|nr:hypothetical protein [Saprospiraceae bacterium]
MGSLQQHADLAILSFYGWWQFIVCLFAFLGLMAIWYHIGRKQKDFGQVWLAVSILCWSFSGLVDIIYSKEWMKIIMASSSTSLDLQSLDQYSPVSLDGWRSILSLLNSLFILLALPWFRYIPSRIEPLITSKYWRLIVGIPFLFALIPTLSRIFFSSSLIMISELDVYFATLTLIFLGWVLFESFSRRRLKFLAYLSILCILITFVAQLYKLTASSANLTLFSAIFKTSLIMIFFALALSWVKELAENIIPLPSQLFFSLKQIKNETGKLLNQVEIKGFPGMESRMVILSPQVFDLLKAFIRKKKDNDQWLEIKPKNETRTGKIYDIKDYNEIKRLISGLLDGIFGKENWTKDHHFDPLKESLFELPPKRGRKIRLKIPGDNLSLNS